MFKIRKNHFEKLIFFLATVIICLTLLEIGLRLQGHKASNISEGEFEQYKNFFRLKKDAVKHNVWSTYSYTVYTNSYGTRDSNIGPVDIVDNPYIVFLGASQVFGQGVDYEDSFVGIFDEYASKKGCEVLNLAVGGHYPSEQEELFRDFMEHAPQKPSVLFFGLSAHTINQFDSRHGNIVVKSGYLFDERSWKMAYIRLMLKNTLTIYRFFSDIVWALDSKLGVLSNIDWVPAHYKAYSANSVLYQDEEVKKLEEYLNSFESYCDSMGIKLVYLYLPLADSFRLMEVLPQLGEDPSDYDTSIYIDFLDNHCRRTGHLFINPRSALKKHYDEGEQLCFGYDIDLHYNKFANEIVGKYLVERISQEYEF